MLHCVKNSMPTPQAHRLANEKHEAFARHYARTFNAEKAALAVDMHPRTGSMLAARPEVQARIAELNDSKLRAADITAERVMLELGRVAFADVRKVFRDDGTLIPIHELSDDAAASIAGIEHETHVKISPKVTRKEIDLATGEETEVTENEITHVRTAKIKRFDKNNALTVLAKHYKIIGDEGDGVNALASALADRLKLARKRSIDMGVADEIRPDDHVRQLDHE